MNCFKWRLFIIIIFFNALANGQNSKNPFLSPLKIPLSLSASFAEPRADHYHSGIDIKTQGVTGKEVVASDEGYVYLLLVSPTGFGRAIFIRHPSGYSTVYGHLERYAPEIEEYVKKVQYENKSFAVTIYPPEGRFKIYKGELIAYTGNSGGSTGPHLHYEIRRTDGEKPVNPLLFDFGIEDNLKPILTRLAVYPVSSNTQINGSNSKIFLDVIGSDGKYSLPEGSTLSISGLAGFGITCYDYMNNSPNKYGINSLQLQIDSMPWFTYEINEFSFYETRYVNAHIDYDAYMRNNITIERCFVLPNDKLSTYKNFMNNGLFDFNDKKSHQVKIIAKDGSGNKSVLSFRVENSVQSTNITSIKKDSCTKILPYNQTNYFSSAGVKITIPNGALYDTLHFKFSKSVKSSRFLSGIYRIHNKYTPVQKPFTLSIKPDTIPPGRSSKLFIAQLDDNSIPSYSGGTFSDGFLTADVSAFGNYTITLDTLPPGISAIGFRNGEDLTGKEEIRFKTTDDLSGIKSYSGAIDGKWALFEYDPRYDLLVYKFDSTRITKGTNHKLSLRVTDNRDNSSSYSCEFVW